VSGCFDTWTSLRELWSAAKRAARGKRDRPSVALALLHLEGVTLGLHRALRAGSWQPGSATCHWICDPKPREIVAAPFEDRIVHQALCAQIGPILDRQLIDHTYACRVGRGTHAALRQARVWARHYRCFAHLDARKYFPSIDHDLLLGMLRRRIGCAQTLQVCERIIAAGTQSVTPCRWYAPGDDLFSPLGRHAGLPIGNLTSQHFANRFLSPVDHFAKHGLRVHAYLRYMDDLLLFDDDRQRLHDNCSRLQRRCEDLRLRLHPWQVQPTRAGVRFLGFVILPDRVRVKRATLLRAAKRLGERRSQLVALAAQRDKFPLAYADAQDRLFASLRATFAHLRYADSYRLRQRILRDIGMLADRDWSIGATPEAALQPFDEMDGMSEIDIEKQ
jgi:hypothetical protein